MEIADFDEIAEEFGRRVRAKIWCIVSTVDRRGRPRSRVLHPVWEGTTGWIPTYPGSHKAKHLEQNPHVSCGYMDPEEPVYVDARAEWMDEPAEKQRVWDFIKQQTPEPYGYDPGTIWAGGPGSPEFGLLKLTPWRIEVSTMRAGQAPDVRVWRPAPSSPLA